ncbi:MAG: EAL domain-containing protein [Micrococcales bacterium]|nr:EAL domain-containing protein [Micrococcales bacterium]
MAGPMVTLPGRLAASWVAVLICAYILAAFSTPGSGLPPVALPAGIVVAAAVALPRPVAGAVCTAALVSLGFVYGQAGYSVGAAMALAVGVLSGSLLMATILRRLHVFRVQALADLFTVGVVAVSVSGMTAGALVVVRPEAVGDWPLWWLTVCLGMVLPLPALVQMDQWHLPEHRGRRVELVLLLSAVGVLTFLAYLARAAVVPGRPGYLLLPVLLWLGLRMGLVAVSGAGTVVAAVLIGGESSVGWKNAVSVAWPMHVVTVLATVIGVLVLYAVALQEQRRRDGERLLQDSQDFVRAMLSNSPAVVAVTHYDQQGVGTLDMVSPMLCSVLNTSAEELRGRSWPDVLGEVLGRQAQQEDLQVLRSSRSQVFVSRVGPRRARRTLMATKFPLPRTASGDRSVGMVALDVTEHRRRDRMMRLTFDLSPVAMARLAVSGDTLGPILDANAALGALLGTDPVGLRGDDLRRFLPPEEREVAWSPDVVREEGRGTAREVRVVTAQGRTLWVAMTISVLHGGDRDDEAFALAVIEDVTDRHDAEQTLTYQARHDALTGLPNRYALVERLEASLQRLWGTKSHVAVLFCDLDGFKTLNDTLSHRAGDVVLVAVAERLRGAVRPQDTVARLGGDEFVVIAEDVATPQQALDLGGRLCDSMRAQFRVQGREVGLSVSVGVATTVDPRTSSEDLLRQADLAMYRAKDAGRNRVEPYVDNLEVAALTRMENQEYLRRAIADGSVHMEYQPVVPLDGGEVNDVEAFVRIPAPGAVGAGDFIDSAQRSGLMGALGGEVLRLAVDDLAQWRRAGLKVRVQLNISPAQVAEQGFPQAVLDQVLAAGLQPGDLGFEVIDSPVLWESEQTMSGLSQLHHLGFQVGIDGFGTGYMGLSALKRVAADYVKIDRSFVAGVVGSREDQVIVQAIIQVAHDLGHEVIAIGVESPAQLEALRALGCDRVQGYLHSAPVRASRVPEIVAAVG